MRFLGYAFPHVFKRSPGLPPPPINQDGYFMYDPQVKLTHEELMARAVLAEEAKQAGTWDATLHHCHGISVFAQLKYFDYKNFFIIPIFHALLYGVMKTFFGIIDPRQKTKGPKPWYQIKNSGLRIIKARELQLTCTSDYTHAHSPLSKKSTWTMDMYLHTALTWSTYIFQDGVGIMDPRVFRMWILLREVIKHYCVVGHEDDWTDKNRADAYGALLLFAKLAQQHVESDGFPVSIMMSNLHLLSCRLYDQESARGAVGFDVELFMEREIGKWKQSTRYRCSAEPERIAIKTLHLDQALLAQSFSHPSLKTISELRAAAGRKDFSSGDIFPLDSVPLADGSIEASRFIGSAVKRRATVRRQRKDGSTLNERELDREMVCDIFMHLYKSDASYEEFPFESNDVSEDSIRVYARANKNDDEILNSSRYDGTKSRVNNIVTLRFGDEPYLGVIDRFILFIAKNNQDFERVFRIAVLKLWPIDKDNARFKPLYGDDLVTVQYDKPWVPNPLSPEYPIPTSDNSKLGMNHFLYPVMLRYLDRKVMVARPGGTDPCMYILKPYNVSRRL